MLALDAAAPAAHFGSPPALTAEAGPYKLELTLESAVFADPQRSCTYFDVTPPPLPPDLEAGAADAEADDAEPPDPIAFHVAAGEGDAPADAAAGRAGLEERLFAGLIADPDRLTGSEAQALAAQASVEVEAQMQACFDALGMELQDGEVGQLTHSLRSVKEDPAGAPAQGGATDHRLYWATMAAWTREDLTPDIGTGDEGNGPAADAAAGAGDAAAALRDAVLSGWSVPGPNHPDARVFYAAVDTELIPPKTPWYKKRTEVSTDPVLYYRIDTPVIAGQPTAITALTRAELQAEHDAHVAVGQAQPATAPAAAAGPSAAPGAAAAAPDAAAPADLPPEVARVAADLSASSQALAQGGIAALSQKLQARLDEGPQEGGKPPTLHVDRLALSGVGLLFAVPAATQVRVHIDRCLLEGVRIQQAAGTSGSAQASPPLTLEFGDVGIDAQRDLLHGLLHAFGSLGALHQAHLIALRHTLYGLQLQALDSLSTALLSAPAAAGDAQHSGLKSLGVARAALSEALGDVQQKAAAEIRNMRQLTDRSGQLCKFFGVDNPCADQLTAIYGALDAAGGAATANTPDQLIAAAAGAGGSLANDAAATVPRIDTQRLMALLEAQCPGWQQNTDGALDRCFDGLDKGADALAWTLALQQVLRTTAEASRAAPGGGSAAALQARTLAVFPGAAKADGAAQATLYGMRYRLGASAAGEHSSIEVDRVVIDGEAGQAPAVIDGVQSSSSSTATGSDSQGSVAAARKGGAQARGLSYRVVQSGGAVEHAEAALAGASVAIKDIALGEFALGGGHAFVENLQGSATQGGGDAEPLARAFSGHAGLDGLSIRGRDEEVDELQGLLRDARAALGDAAAEAPLRKLEQALQRIDPTQPPVAALTASPFGLAEARAAYVELHQLVDEAASARADAQPAIYFVSHAEVDIDDDMSGSVRLYMHYDAAAAKQHTLARRARLQEELDTLLAGRELKKLKKSAKKDLSLMPTVQKAEKLMAEIDPLASLGVFKKRIARKVQGIVEGCSADVQASVPVADGLPDWDRAAFVCEVTIDSTSRFKGADTISFALRQAGLRVPVHVETTAGGVRRVTAYLQGDGAVDALAYADRQVSERIASGLGKMAEGAARDRFEQRFGRGFIKSQIFNGASSALLPDFKTGVRLLALGDAEAAAMAYSPTIFLTRLLDTRLPRNRLQMAEKALRHQFWVWENRQVFAAMSRRDADKGEKLDCVVCPADLKDTVLSHYELKWLKPRSAGLPPDAGGVKGLAAPEISNCFIATIEPPTGAPGSEVTVTLAATGAEAGAWTVKFGGAAATVATPPPPAADDEADDEADDAAAAAATSEATPAASTSASGPAAAADAAPAAAGDAASPSPEAAVILEPPARKEAHSRITVCVPAGLAPGVVTIVVEGGAQPMTLVNAFVVTEAPPPEAASAAEPAPAIVAAS